MKRIIRNAAATVIAIPLFVVGMAFLFFPSPRKVA